jgi:LEA14-like dessication related protein
MTCTDDNKTRLRTWLFGTLLVVAAAGLSGCATWPNRDPLMIDVAGIESLPGEGMELRLLVKVRVQNPNDAAVEYSGVALTLDLNDIRLASGVSDDVGTVPRYGESVFAIPVTISAFDMARHVLALTNTSERDDVTYRVEGKLQGGLFGTRRFIDEGTFQLSDEMRNPASQ